MQPLESTHPVLRRHYSTIGIGDVFVQPDDSWLLPSMYYQQREDGTTESNTESGHSSRQPLHPQAEPVVVETCCKSSSSPLSSSTSRVSSHAMSMSSTASLFDDGISIRLLDEMIGTIKLTPEDFVVREMAVVQGAIRVADLSLQQELQESAPSSLSTTSLQANSVPPTDTASPKSNNVGSSEKDQQSTEPCATMQGGGAPGPRTANGSSVTRGDDEQDPMGRLASTLDLYQIEVEWTKSSRPASQATAASNDTTHPASREALVALSELEQEAIGAMNSASAESIQTCNNLPELLLLEVFLTLVSKVSIEDVGLQKSMKREIHDGIRSAFPLLSASSVPITIDKATEPATLSPTMSGNFWKTQIRVTIDDCFLNLAAYLYAPAQDLPPLYAFAKNGYEHSLQQVKRERANGCSSKTFTDAARRNPGDRRRPLKPGPILRLRPDLPRDDRRPIHQTIDSKSKGLLSTETLKDFPLSTLPETRPDEPMVEKAIAASPLTTTAILVHWSSVAARKVSKKRSRDESRAVTAGQVPASKFLLCVLQKRKKEHLALINTLSAALHCRSADIGLSGIKDCQAVAYQFCTLENFESQRVVKSTEYLSERCIEVIPLHKVNQALSKGDLVGNRFEITVRNLRRVELSKENDGNHTEVASLSSLPVESFVPVDENHVKKMVERVQASGFINFYGEQRVGEPGHASFVGVRAFDIGRAMLQQDFFKAIDLLVQGRRVSNGVEMSDDAIDSFRKVWRATGGDPAATTKHMPSGMTSVPRERAVIKGLIRYGKDNPLAALRCLQRNERLFFVNGYQSYVWNVMATERMRRYGNKVVVGDLLLLNGSKKPEIATEEHLQERIDDVVLPMVGYDVLYPQNDIGDLYHQFLERENVKLDKSAPDESTAKGSYRRLVVAASNLSYTRTPKHDDGTTDVKFVFDLPKGAYATMFLRELMLKTVHREATTFTDPPDS